jgi:outer membrane protein TolC
MTIFKPSKTLGAIFLLTAAAAAPASAQKNAPAPTRNPSQTQNLLQIQSQPSDVRIKGNRSITLRQAIDLSEKNNREIEAVRLQVDSSTAATRGFGDFTVTASGALEKNGTPVIANNANTNTFNGSSTPLTGNIQAAYNIFGSGARKKAAEEQVNFDKLEVDRVSRRVRGDVITAYYDLQEADEQLKINEAAVKNSDRSLRDAKLQEQAGLGTKFDVIRAEVQKATAVQDVIRIGSQQKNARKRLAQILNVTENIEYSASEDVKPRGTWGISLENSIILAYGNRPELKQSAVRRKLSEEQERVASDGSKPRYNLVASYGLRRDFQQSEGFSDSYNVGAQVRWDFLDGGVASSGAEQARAAQAVADAQYITSRDQIRLQVEQAFNTLTSDELNIVTSTGGLKQAEESLRLARLRFAAGVGTQTDVISAETALTTARSNRLRAVIGYNRSLSTLRNAVYAVRF